MHFSANTFASIISPELVLNSKLCRCAQYCTGEVQYNGPGLRILVFWVFLVVFEPGSGFFLKKSKIIANILFQQFIL